MSDYKLEAQPRGEGYQKTLETIPSVVYGHSFETQSLKLKRTELEKIYNQAGSSNLIDLKINNQEPVKVLIKDLQRHPVKDLITHVDFYKVNMKEKIDTTIPLNFVGEPRAVKELGAFLMKDLEEVEVTCLPSDLVDHIDVDISSLNDFDDNIKLEDLNLPKGMELVSETNDVVISVARPTQEEEEEIPAEGEEGEEVAEGEEKKEEGEEEKTE